ncbi:hypothetical protein Ptr902_09710 [Pyrenophora tritici-repentis]|nr:hypothetical protein Alg130_00917 [Pyrenophora tritici-repentis]KAI2478744.1 hypothetical protein Ptr902_09710 [Pyrenophora tritici-repentis]
MADMPISYPPGRPKPTSAFLPPHDSTRYVPDRVSSLAAWLASRRKDVSRKDLKGMDLNCMLCEYPMCDYWTRVKTSDLLAADTTPSSNRPSPLIYPEIPHTCCTLVQYCEHAVRIDSHGCGHYVGYRCLRNWIIAGFNWCRFCGAEWFLKEPSRTRRRAALKESLPIDFGMNLEATVIESEDDQKPGRNDGAVGRGMWKNIYTREMARLAMAGYTVDTKSSKKQVLKMDPTFFHAQGRLRDEDQDSLGGVPATVPLDITKRRKSH